MIRSMLRRIAATLIVATAATATASLAAVAPPEETPPPKAYEIPTKGIKDYIVAAVKDPARQPYMTIHDAYRKPAELMALARVKPGSNVVELSSYGNYYSMMLSSAVGPKGHLHMYDMPFWGDQVAKQEQDFVSKHPNTDYQNVDFNKIEFPRNVDVVWCVMCFHEILLTGTELTAFHAKLYKAMKPGATYLLVFARARDLTETDDTGKLHRIDPAAVRANVQAAGFTLYQEDRMLENHDDDHTSPVMTEKDVDLADRTVYEFRKVVTGGG
jgi:predicted methyltransferase